MKSERCIQRWGEGQRWRGQKGKEEEVREVGNGFNALEVKQHFFIYPRKVRESGGGG